MDKLKISALMSLMWHNHLKARSQIGKRARMPFKSPLTSFRKHNSHVCDFASEYGLKATPPRHVA